MNKRNLVFIITFTPTVALAYSGNTHKILATESADTADFSDVIEAFDLQDAHFPDAFGMSSTPDQQMGFGARFEDGCPEVSDTKCDQSDEYTNSNTPLNHFYDPQQGGQGLTMPWPCPDIILSSADWALEDGGQIGERTYCGFLTVTPQRYSYSDAVSYFKDALIGATPQARRSSAGRMFQAFGHLAHHLHDMAQPQHVRDDMHCPEAMCALAGRYEPSLLEEIANHPDIIQQCIGPWVADRRTKYPNVPVYGALGPRTFWSTGTGIGMAEFTNWNFTSVDSNFVGSLSDPEPTYPGKHALPDPDFSNGEWGTETTDIQTMLANTCLQNGWEKYRELEGELTFITRDLKDPYNGRIYNNVKISTYSIFTDDLAAKNEVMPNDEFYLPIYSLNPFNYEDAYRVLLPRAVTWVDGLLKHFFRGKLDVSVEDKTVTVANRSGFPMDGELALYYDDRSGVRRRLTASDVDLPANASHRFTVTIPEPAAGFDGEYVAVFDGTVGTVRGVAGKSFVGPQLVIPCGTTVSLSGGTGETKNQSIELGNESGPVRLEFEAYQIPDSFEVAVSGSGQVLKEANLVQGYNTYEFEHRPEATGSTRVDVTVTGNEDEATAWKFGMGCPNQTDIDLLPRVWVHFETKGNHLCDADFYVDGKRVAPLHGLGGSFTVEMTEGTRHYYEYKNYSGICDFTYHDYWSLSYRDGSGTYSLDSPILSRGGKYFTVR